jgi:hypothetical protein
MVPLQTGEESEALNRAFFASLGQKMRVFEFKSGSKRGKSGCIYCFFLLAELKCKKKKGKLWKCSTKKLKTPHKKSSMRRWKRK